jgi:hypothetical protein
MFRAIHSEQPDVQRMLRDQTLPGRREFQVRDVVAQPGGMPRSGRRWWVDDVEPGVGPCVDRLMAPSVHRQSSLQDLVRRLNMHRG